ncbi:YeeE/YedE family protein [Bdellovibrio sp. SKB1291214]|uniref:YeeE/YedE family protein n=1 Tax=Bdellovibrio sp. SKB1291214 TaxID=1732569 RepID=UPI000B5187DB|nr:YeeE/YedE family protein [Bdellovibrio sp. SKB1291214]UYL09394.1 YeeE/YedE family protein [Bdellovibrio sp. SKB1291214]
MQENILMALGGGAVIGLATALFLILNGRVTGISGILNGLFTYNKSDYFWRLFFVIGMITGGIVLTLKNPAYFEPLPSRNSAMILMAGLLVGFGTVMGSGCTSGHGICGVARMSPRSIIATICFMITGMLVANFLRWIVGV